MIFSLIAYCFISNTIITGNKQKKVNKHAVDKAIRIRNPGNSCTVSSWLLCPFDGKIWIMICT